jgi:dTDP-4-dehydrorhamnose 3,5-epimerase
MGVTSLFEIHGVRIVEAYTNQDFRGRFVKYFPSEFLDHRLDSIAFSLNPKVGTIRGLHFQVAPYAEEKIVSCIQGATYEVIVDIRPGSKTFGKFATIQLSEENPQQIYLPKGIAHGFQTLLPNTIVHYVLTSQYSRDSSFSIDPLNLPDIKWPINQFTISEKDQNGISIEEAGQRYATSIAD